MSMSVRLSLLAIASSLVACGGSLATPGDGGAPDTGPHSDQDAEAGPPHTGDDDGGPPALDASGPPVGTIAGDKVDILFMIDNSAGMGAKQALLAASVPAFLQRLTAPFCVDAGDPSKVIAP